jgi:Fe-S-cluster containining protein
MEDIEIGTKIIRHTLKIYQENDSAASDLMAQHGIVPSCSKGCSHCCNQYINIDFVEAFALAYFLSESQVWKDRIPELKKRLTEAANQTLLIDALYNDLFDGKIRGAEAVEVFNKDSAKAQNLYFDRRIPCVLLDAETNQCSAYEHRPFPCRYHFVTNDPSLCSDSKAFGCVVNLVKLEHAIIKANKDLVKSVGMTMTHGSLPAMVLKALDCFTNYL